MALKEVPGSEVPLQEMEFIPRRPYNLAWVKNEADREAGSHIIQFKFGFMETEAIVTVRVVFNDAQSGADMVVTNMTTLPSSVCGQGYGSEVLRMLLAGAKKKGMHNIQAVQVQKPSESFWVRNGFVPLRNVTNDFQYEEKLNPGT